MNTDNETKGAVMVTPAEWERRMIDRCITINTGTTIITGLPASVKQILISQGYTLAQVNQWIQCATK